MKIKAGGDSTGIAAAAEITAEQFLSFNPYIYPLCDNLVADTNACVSSPSSASSNGTTSDPVTETSQATDDYP